MDALDGLSADSAEYWRRGRDLVEQARDGLAVSSAGIRRKAKEAEKFVSRREVVIRKLARDAGMLTAALRDAYRFRDEALSYAAYLASCHGVDATSAKPSHRLSTHELTVLDDGICDFLAGELWRNTWIPPRAEAVAAYLLKTSETVELLEKGVADAKAAHEAAQVEGGLASRPAQAWRRAHSSAASTVRCLDECSSLAGAIAEFLECFDENDPLSLDWRMRAFNREGDAASRHMNEHRAAREEAAEAARELSASMEACDREGTERRAAITSWREGAGPWRQLARDVRTREELRKRKVRTRSPHHAWRRSTFDSTELVTDAAQSAVMALMTRMSSQRVRPGESAAHFFHRVDDPVSDRGWSG
jgi:hypothetical protein